MSVELQLTDAMWHQMQAVLTTVKNKAGHPQIKMTECSLKRFSTSRKTVFHGAHCPMNLAIGRPFITA